jgi:hypothetical protein
MFLNGTECLNVIENKLIEGNTENVNETNFKDINYVVLTLFGPFGIVRNTFLFIRSVVN